MVSSNFTNSKRMEVRKYNRVKTMLADHDRSHKWLMEKMKVSRTTVQNG